MRYLIGLTGMVLMLAGCRVSQPPSINTTVKDSVIIKHDVVYRDTTIYVTMPQSNQQNVLVDTLRSVLENETAITKAWIDNGYLKHTLTSKREPIKVYLPKVIKEVVRDTERIRGKDVVQVATQKVNELTWWQKKRLQAFSWLLAAVVVYALYRFVWWWIRSKRLF